MPEPVIQNVSDTAFMVAMWRAKETERPDALFRDPLAAKLAGERGKDIVARLPRHPFGPWSVAVRTVIIDEYIEAALARGVDTVLNLGAGLDTRPYRMALPKDLRWIEVDYPPVIELKETRLSSDVPRCVLERAKVDLADLPARRRLFEEVDARSKHVLVLMEGVLPYLTVEEGESLADDLRRMKSVRFWIVEYLSPEVMRYRRRASRGRHFRNAPFRFEPKDWFGFFEAHGWKAKDTRYLVEEGARLGRRIPLPLLLRAWIAIRRRFASSARRSATKRFAGYVLLEPM
jgi:methyltransferase (TIGR00027 family)